jgi:hypothetical protein
MTRLLTTRLAPEDAVPTYESSEEAQLNEIKAGRRPVTDFAPASTHAPRFPAQESPQLKTDGSSLQERPLSELITSLKSISSRILAWQQRASLWQKFTYISTLLWVWPLMWLILNYYSGLLTCSVFLLPWCSASAQAQISATFHDQLCLHPGIGWLCSDAQSLENFGPLNALFEAQSQLGRIHEKSHGFKGKYRDIIDIGTSSSHTINEWTLLKDPLNETSQEQLRDLRTLLYHQCYGLANELLKFTTTMQGTFHETLWAATTAQELIGRAESNFASRSVFARWSTTSEVGWHRNEVMKNYLSITQTMRKFTLEALQLAYACMGHFDTLNQIWDSINEIRTNRVRSLQAEMSDRNRTISQYWNGARIKKLDDQIAILGNFSLIPREVEGQIRAAVDELEGLSSGLYELEMRF